MLSIGVPRRGQPSYQFAITRTNPSKKRPPESWRDFGCGWPGVCYSKANHTRSPFMREIFRHPLTLLLTVLTILLVTTTAQGQDYFGRNKVQYKDFKFEVMKTDHFDIYFYPEERDAAARVARMAERWYSRHSQLFGHEMKTRQPLVLYASHPDFEQTNVVGGALDEGTGGVTEGMKRRV